MRYYYLINGEVKKTFHEMPKKENLKNQDNFDVVFSIWKKWFEKCEISSYEYEKIINNIDNELLEQFYPIDITSMVHENNGKIVFKTNDNNQSLEDVFRGFLRSNHLTSKWENYLKENNIALK